MWLPIISKPPYLEFAPITDNIFQNKETFQQPYCPWYILLFTEARHNPVGHPHKTPLWRILEFGRQIWYSE